MFIVKIQRPLGGSPGIEHKMLVYNEPRSITEQLTLTEERMRAYFPNGELKVYRYAEQLDDDGLVILGPAPLQSW